MRGVFPKKRQKERVNALTVLKQIPVSFDAGDFGTCYLFPDDPDLHGKVMASMFVHQTPIAFLSSIQLRLKDEYRYLKLHKWFESVTRRDESAFGPILDVSREVCDDFREWYALARDILETDILAAYRTEGETPLGKGWMKMLEKRFGSHWNDDMLAADSADSGADKAADIAERFKEFLA